MSLGGTALPAMTWAQSEGCWALCSGIDTLFPNVCTVLVLGPVRVGVSQNEGWVSSGLVKGVCKEALAWNICGQFSGPI